VLVQPFCAWCFSTHKPTVRVPNTPLSARIEAPHTRALLMLPLLILPLLVLPLPIELLLLLMPLLRLHELIHTWSPPWKVPICGKSRLIGMKLAYGWPRVSAMSHAATYTTDMIALRRGKKRCSALLRSRIIVRIQIADEVTILHPRLWRKSISLLRKFRIVECILISSSAFIVRWAAAGW